MEETGTSGLNQPWAARFTSTMVPAAAALRLREDVEACRTDEGLWVRGPLLNEHLHALLTRMAPDRRCRVLPDGQLVPTGRRVPVGYLPEGPWHPLQEILRITVPDTLWPAALPHPISLKLGRSTVVQDANALLSCMSEFLAYADSAPGIRLERLAFAADAAGRVTICGTPLPPISGTALVETAGILLPCGWHWQPNLPNPIVRQVLKLHEGELALVSVTASVEILRADQFVQARRASVRQTALGVR